MTDDQDDPYDASYTFEALIIADILQEDWHRRVADSRCAEQYPDVKQAVQRAAEAMFAAYDLMGRKLEEGGVTKPLLEVVPKQ